MNFRSLVSLALLATLAFAGAQAPLPAMLRRNEITRVDLAARVITVGVDPADAKSYRCSATTTILIDDKRATLEELAPGMMAIVTATTPGVAARVTAMKAATPTVREPRGPMERLKIIVPAAALARNPVTIAGVRAGQYVTIVARDVRWTSGGSRAGQYCDWNGYPDEKVHDLPRMALVAAVGRAIYLPSGETFHFTVAADGPFVLFANDDDAAGNDGQAEITITVGWK